MRVNLAVLLVLALVAASLNACGAPKREYWSGLADVVGQKSR